MRVVSSSILTEATYDAGLAAAEALEAGIARLIANQGLPWHVSASAYASRFVCSTDRPHNGTEAGVVAHDEIEHTLHLFASTAASSSRRSTT